MHVTDAGAFRPLLEEVGFIREDQIGDLRNFWYLPEVARYGVQIVSGQLFDGRCERTRIRVLTTESGSSFALPPVEDLIADRLGQHAVASPTDDAMLLQARLLLSLAEDIDHAHLRRRVQDEGGDISLLD